MDVFELLYRLLDNISLHCTFHHDVLCDTNLMRCLLKVMDRYGIYLPPADDDPQKLNSHRIDRAL